MSKRSEYVLSVSSRGLDMGLAELGLGGMRPFVAPLPAPLVTVQSQSSSAKQFLIIVEAGCLLPAEAVSSPSTGGCRSARGEMPTAETSRRLPDGMGLGVL